MKKVLLQCYFNKNLGDDLFIKIVREQFKDCEITCLLPDGTDIDSVTYLGIKSWTYKKMYRRLDKILYRMFNKTPILDKFVGEFNQVIILGGSLFIEHKDWKNQLYIYKRLVNSANRVDIIGANFGPFTSDLFLKEYTNLFRNVNNIVFRDIESVNYFPELTNVIVRKDFVLNLNIDRYGKRNDNSIAISVMNIKSKANLEKYSENYFDFLKLQAEYFLSKGYNVKLFSFCEPEGDLEACELLAKMIDSENVDIVNYDNNINHVLEEYSNCEYVIGTRFHSSILGILFQKKILPLSYSVKTNNALGLISNELEVININSLATQRIDVTNYNKIKELEMSDTVDSLKIIAGGR
ncbi:polysaccharide pyruvyl transferase family protein [Latilactobacillus sakei]|uniref:polysaccharide pyruvyl transferase family protein n=1 Tax=Latilactobacillus sakei TaxID=1599 RepID=UPI00313386E3